MPILALTVVLAPCACQIEEEIRDCYFIVTWPLYDRCVTVTGRGGDTRVAPLVPRPPPPVGRRHARALEGASIARPILQDARLVRSLLITVTRVTVTSLGLYFKVLGL